MGQSSWPGHFRNPYRHRRDWRIFPFSGTIRYAVSPVSFGGRIAGEMCGRDVPTNVMRKTNPSRGWRAAALSALAAVCLCGTTICLSGAALAASSVPPATSSDNAPAKQATPSKSAGASGSASTSHAATTHKSTTHKSSAHKATSQAARAKTSSHSASSHAASSHSTSSHRSSSHVSSSHAGQRTTASRGKNSSKNLRGAKKRGQQAIDRDRARAIQEALIREHYMDGEPSGTWDAATQAAMQRYQADQGWQSKTTPDSRALIKLGLGPSNDHLLNPESAMTSAPVAGDPKATTKSNPTATPRPQQ